VASLRELMQRVVTDLSGTRLMALTAMRQVRETYNEPRVGSRCRGTALDGTPSSFRPWSQCTCAHLPYRLRALRQIAWCTSSTDTEGGTRSHLRTNPCQIYCNFAQLYRA